MVFTNTYVCGPILFACTNETGHSLYMHNVNRHARIAGQQLWVRACESRWLARVQVHAAGRVSARFDLFESREHYLLRSTNALCLSQGHAPPLTQRVCFTICVFAVADFFAINRRCFVSDLFARTAWTAESGPLVGGGGGGGGGAPGPSICCSVCHFCPNCQHVRRLLSRPTDTCKYAPE
jgi:hypothetical protein